MRFQGPLKAHEHSSKANPKQTLIVDAVFLGLVVALTVLITVLVIVNYGFNPILILAWIMLGAIALWLGFSIFQCARRMKRMESKKDEESL